MTNTTQNYIGKIRGVKIDPIAQNVNEISFISEGKLGGGICRVLHSYETPVAAFIGPRHREIDPETGEELSEWVHSVDYMPDGGKSQVTERHKNKWLATFGSNPIYTTDNCQGKPMDIVSQDYLENLMAGKK